MKKGWQIAKLAAMGLLIIAFLFVAISGIRQQEAAVCKKIDIRINFDEQKNFLDKDDILKHIDNDTASQLLGKSLGKLDLEALEQKVNADPYVRRADIYTDPSGEMVVQVEQKEPALRIINMSGVSYYLTDRKEIIPLSGKFTPRVLVAAGNFSGSPDQQETIYRDVYRIDSFIRQNDFWTAMVDELCVDSLGHYEILTKAAKHSVILGDASELKDKFRRLEIFYKECFGRIDWDQYESINISFRGQVVGKKKNNGSNQNIP